MTAFRSSLVATLSTIALVSAIQWRSPQTVERRWGWGTKVRIVNSPASPLALEFSGLEAFTYPSVISSHGKSTVSQSRDSLTPVGPQPEKPISGVIYEIERKGDRVNLQVWAMFNDMRHPEWWKYRDQLSLGKFELEEGSSITLEKLALQGFKPISLKIIPAPIVSIPLDAIPIRNRTKSIEIISIKERFGWLMVTLRNNSEKLAAAVSIKSEIQGYGSGGMLRPFSPERYLPPHGATQVEFSAYRPLKMTLQGWVDATQTPAGLAIDLVMFSDGSFEGDEKQARKLIVAREGRRKEFSLAVAEMNRIVKLEDGALLEAWENFRLQISEYPQQEKARRGKANSSLEDGDIFWVFHQGMYDGRNYLQSGFDRVSQILSHPEISESKAQVIRRTIVELMVDIEKWSKYLQ